MVSLVYVPITKAAVSGRWVNNVSGGVLCWLVLARSKLGQRVAQLRQARDIEWKHAGVDLVSRPSDVMLKSRDVLLLVMKSLKGRVRNDG